VCDLIIALQAEKWTYDAEKNLLIPGKVEHCNSLLGAADDSEERD
jgi:hypothetical protein